MANVSRFWNGRLLGMPKAAYIVLTSMLMRVADRFNTILWRGNLGSIGSGSIVQAGVTIRYPGNIHVGRNTNIGRGVSFTSEKPDSNCWLGDDVIINQGVHIDFSGGLEIGSNVVISACATIYTHSHGMDPKSISAKTPLVIEDDVWIGSHAILIEHTGRIGRGALVASGSVVTREVPPDVVVGGAPAKFIRARFN